MKEKFENLTDEEVLKEFVKRFQCDGAILIYQDSGIEYGFGRWRNIEGRKWVNKHFKVLEEDHSLNKVAVVTGDDELTISF